MKPYLFTFLLMAGVAASCQAQIGLGLGSGGINIKSSVENKLRIIGRANFFFSDLSQFSPSLHVVSQFVNESQIKAYFGGGIGADIRFSEFDEHTIVHIKAPLGVEFFPLEGKNISVTVESGLVFSTGEDLNNLYIPAIFEFTFYLR